MEVDQRPSGKYRSTIHHGDVVPIEKDLVEFGNTASFRCRLKLHDILEDHVDEIVETKQRAYDLLVILHDDVDA